MVVGAFMGCSIISADITNSKKIRDSNQWVFEAMCISLLATGGDSGGNVVI
jgi:hypothetical protein